MKKYLKKLSKKPNNLKSTEIKKNISIKINTVKKSGKKIIKKKILKKLHLKKNFKNKSFKNFRRFLTKKQIEQKAEAKENEIFLEQFDFQSLLLELFQKNYKKKIIQPKTITKTLLILRFKLYKLYNLIFYYSKHKFLKKLKKYLLHFVKIKIYFKQKLQILIIKKKKLLNFKQKTIKYLIFKKISKNFNNSINFRTLKNILTPNISNDMFSNILNKIFLILNKLKTKTDFVYFLNFPNNFFKIYKPYFQFHYFKKLLINKYLKNKTLLNFTNFFFLKYINSLNLNNIHRLKQIKNIKFNKIKNLLKLLKYRHYFYLFSKYKKILKHKKKFKYISSQFLFKVKNNHKLTLFYDYFLNINNNYYYLFPKNLIQEYPRLNFIFFYNWKFGRISNYSNVRQNFLLHEQLKFNKPQILFNFKPCSKLNKISTEIFQLPFFTIFPTDAIYKDSLLIYFFKLFLKTYQITLYNKFNLNFIQKKYKILKLIELYKKQLSYTIENENNTNKI